MSSNNKTGSLKGTLLVFVITAICVFTIGSVVGTQTGLVSVSDLLDNEDDTSLFNSIPDDSNIVMRIDADGLSSDKTTRMIANNTSDGLLYENGSISEQLIKKPIDSINKTNFNVNVDDDDLNEIIMFSNFGIGKTIIGSNYRGAVININNISGDELGRLAYGEESEYRTEQYKGFEIQRYNKSDKSVAKLDNNLYVIGDSIAINKSIDTIRGDEKVINNTRIPDIEGDTYVSINAQNLTTVFGKINAGRLAGMRIPNNVSMSYTTDDNNNVTINIDADSVENENSEINLNDKLKFGSNVTGVEETSVNLSSTSIDATYTTKPEDFEETYNNITSLYGDSSVNGPFTALKEFENNVSK